MSSAQEDNVSTATKSYEKLARMYHYIAENYIDHRPGLEKFLELEGDINYQVPESSCLKFLKPNTVGNTALHFLAQRCDWDTKSSFRPPLLDSLVERCDPKAAELLINHGANPALKNQQGLTPIHQIIGCIYKIKFESGDPFMAQGRLEVPFIDVLLAAHVRHQNSTNPRDPYGISHFHAACMVNDIVAVEFYLNNQVAVDEAVNMDSPMFPGYTPLHFAARLGCVEAANVLLSRRANLLLKDSKGMTALHLAIERNMRIVRLVNLCRREDDLSGRRTQTQKEEYLVHIENTKIIIASILSKMDKTMIDSLDLSAFYLMHTLKDALFVENDINEAIGMNSAFCPGYTALHFAAHLNVNTFKKLLEYGADMEAKDANGETPLDMCAGVYDVENIHEIICSHVKWREIRLSDGKTKLVDLLLPMRNSSEFKNYIDSTITDINNIRIPIGSPLWPGSTILHLAVILSKKFIDTGNYFLSFDCYNVRPNKLIEVCLRLGADATIQDFHGSTPLHLAVRRLDVDNTYFLIENHNGKSNPVDKDNLTHLHIACVVSNESAVKKLINCRFDVNAAVSSSLQCEGQVMQMIEDGISRLQYFTICAGSTALHIAVMAGSLAIMKLLMEAGADLDAKDANGLTALHLLFMNSCLKSSIGEILQSSLILKDCVVNGLSYLHVASYGNCLEAIEKFIRLGTDVDSTVLTGSFFEEYEGNTPLHIAVDDRDENAAVTLTTHGADVFAENSKGQSPICGILSNDYLLQHYTSLMNEDNERRLIEEMGVTKLHMACKLCDEKMIQDVVKNGANVNAQIRNDSKIWPGYTPLHILVACYDPLKHKDKICRITRFLLINGADVTIADVRGETPLLMNIDNHSEDVRPPHINILMISLKNTVVNPVNHQGISHFHVACIRNNVAVVERFLKLGVDVNQTVDYFSDVYPGFTPLHFASCRRCNWLRNDIPPLRTIHLLLKYGANVHARDVTDDTPLHIAALYRSFFHLPYKRILWAGADPEAKNAYGKVPLHYLYSGSTYNLFNWYSCGCGIRRRIIGL